MSELAQDSGKQFRIGVVTTAYYPNSHADVIVSRWLSPQQYDRQWDWHGPGSRLVSLYVDTRGENDISEQVAREHQLPLCATVREALTLGGQELAVDAVLLIGEHGDYPTNAFGQKLYPRKELFDEIVATFDACGRCVPVFCDKHYSWDYQAAVQMVEDAKRRGFMFFGGSSLTYCKHQPAMPELAGKRIGQAMGIFAGTESQAFHSVEIVQSLIEARAGGEQGVRSVTAYTGDEVWRQQDAGRWPAKLVDAILENNPTAAAGDYRLNAQGEAGAPAAWVIEHVDGLQVTHLNVKGHLHESWCAGVQLAGYDATYPTTPMMGDAQNHYAHFARLSGHIERAFMTGEHFYPPQRTLLTTGIVAAMQHALAQPGQPLATPQLEWGYDAKF